MIDRMRLDGHTAKIIHEPSLTLIVAPDDFIARVIACALTGVQPHDQEGRMIDRQYVVAVPFAAIKAGHVRRLIKFLEGLNS